MNPQQIDPRKAKIQAYGQYQIYCVIPIVVLAVLHHQAIDARYALYSLIFRVAISLVAIAAMIVLEVKKQALKKTIAAEEAEARRQNPGATPGVWPPPPG